VQLLKIKIKTLSVHLQEFYLYIPKCEFDADDISSTSLLKSQGIECDEFCGNESAEFYTLKK
jgi:hypothetical protein